MVAAVVVVAAAVVGGKIPPPIMAVQVSISQLTWLLTRLQEAWPSKPSSHWQAPLTQVEFAGQLPPQSVVGHVTVMLLQTRSQFRPLLSQSKTQNRQPGSGAAVVVVAATVVVVARVVVVGAAGVVKSSEQPQLS